MTQEKYDVVVVGAGPAGSTAAKFIADEGYKVLLVDKAIFPRDKPCGGALTKRVIDRFPHLAERISSLVISEIFSGKIYSPSFKYAAKMQSDEPLGYFVCRDKFDHELVRIAMNAGAKFKDEFHVTDVVFKKDQVLIQSKTGLTISARVIIGADGVMSTIAKKSGLNRRWKREQIGVCVLKEFDLDKNLINEIQKSKIKVHIHIAFQNIYGYAWCFLKNNKINVGIGCLLSEKKSNLKDLFRQYVEHLKREKLIPDIDITNLKGALIPLKSPLDKTYGDKILLVGDAAGFVNSLSGEGLYYAISSGEIAARTCLNILKKGQDFSEKNLNSYQKSWMKDFGKELNTLLFLRRFTRIWLEGIIKYANLDKKWRNMIINAMLGFRKISRSALGRRYLWCRWKFWLIDMFKSVEEAIYYSASLFFGWGAQQLNQFYDGFQNMVLNLATLGQIRLPINLLIKNDAIVWKDIIKTIKNTKNNRDQNMLNYVFSKFNELLTRFVQKLRIVVNSL